MEDRELYIKEALSNLKLEQLNKMQEETIKSYSRSRDIILLSPTGSGKTLAFLLPLISSLDKNIKGVQAIIIVPSRELALQIDQVFSAINSPFKSVCCYGGRPAMEENRTMKGVNPSVVIGTPGRLNDHLNKGNIDATTITTLIIDEFDKSLEYGFQDEMNDVISKLPNIERRLLTSATDAVEIPPFTGMSGRTVKLDYLDKNQTENKRLSLYKVSSPVKDKLDTLYNLLCVHGSESTIVFCNHRESVERVGKYLKSKKLDCGIFHGGMEQDDRERSLYKFRNGSCHVLISTDLAARGLDIPEIENVIHYHIPANQEAFIHRNGRTARWEAEGNSFIILGPEETVPDYIEADIEDFNIPENVPKPSLPDYVTLYIGKGKKDKINKIDIVGFLFKKGNLNKDDIGRIDVKDHYAFVAINRKKSKQTLSLIQNEKIKGIKTIFEEAK